MPTQDNAAINTAPVTLTTTTETTIVTAPPVSYNAPGGEGNYIEGNIVAAFGAGVTSYQWKVYQNAILVQASGNITCTASTTVDIGFACLDTSAAARSAQNIFYGVTLTANAATGNSTVATGLGVISITPVSAAS
jgi:hypothetical protein